MQSAGRHAHATADLRWRVNNKTACFCRCPPPPPLNLHQQQLLAKGNILSAPLLVSPGLEDIESLEPAETSSTLVSVERPSSCRVKTARNASAAQTGHYTGPASRQASFPRHATALHQVNCVSPCTLALSVCVQVGWLDIKDIIRAFLACELDQHTVVTQQLWGQLVVRTAPAVPRGALKATHYNLQLAGDVRLSSRHHLNPPPPSNILNSPAREAPPAAHQHAGAHDRT